MTTKIYDVGDVVRCTATFSVSGTNTDPSAVTFKYKAPSGTITTYVYGTDAQLVKSAVGIYYVDVTVSAPGSYAYRFSSTGTGRAAAEGRFEASHSQF